MKQADAPGNVPEWNFEQPGLDTGLSEDMKHWCTEFFNRTKYDIQKSKDMLTPPQFEEEVSKNIKLFHDYIRKLEAEILNNMPLYEAVSLKDGTTEVLYIPDKYKKIPYSIGGKLYFKDEPTNEMKVHGLKVALPLWQMEYIQLTRNYEKPDEPTAGQVALFFYYLRAAKLIPEPVKTSWAQLLREYGLDTYDGKIRSHKHVYNTYRKIHTGDEDDPATQKNMTYVIENLMKDYPNAKRMAENERYEKERGIQ